MGDDATLAPMSSKSIYRNQCPQLQQLFTQAGSLERVIVVAFDFARDTHMALLCNGLGQQLLKPFAVHNNAAGVEHLNQRLRALCKRQRVDPTHVFMGGEDDPPYAQNFLWALHADWLVLRVNAWLAKQQRENLQASSDKLDLLGIAKVLLNRQATPVFATEALADPSPLLKTLGRDRDAIVRDQTRLANRIHAHVKILFPGFLSEKSDNPLEAFSHASLALMEADDFNAATYARKQNAPLARRLKKLRCRQCENQAAQLIARAKDALHPPPHLVEPRQQALQQLVGLWRAHQQAAAQLEQQQARHLARSPAALLTSLPGLGVVSAAALAGELGPPQHLRTRARMSSYAGIVPGSDQTGGPESPPQTKGVKHRCNHRLKNHLVRTALRMGELLGPPEIRAHYRRLKDAGQHAPFIHARKLLGLAKALMQKGVIWLPQHLREGAQGDEDSRQKYRLQMYEHLLEYWPKLCAKWKAHHARGLALQPENPLGQWREAIEQLYQIQLPPNQLPIGNQELSPQTTPA